MSYNDELLITFDYSIFSISFLTLIPPDWTPFQRARGNNEANQAHENDADADAEADDIKSTFSSQWIQYAKCLALLALLTDLSASPSCSKMV